MEPARINIMWFRRDLRLYDNAALYHALKDGIPVLPVFIFDSNILDQLDDRRDARVEFIHLSILGLQQQLLQWGSTLEVYHGTPGDVFNRLSEKYRIEAVFANHDYERYARERDGLVQTQLAQKNILFRTYKDQVIFEKDEIVKDDNSPYTVFTPYSRKWKAKLSEAYLEAYPVEKHTNNFYSQPAIGIPSLQSLGFQPAGISFPPGGIDDDVLHSYARKRDFPSIGNGTSHLGLHLRFGTMSIRELAKHSVPGSEVYLNELIWREFYQAITWHFPHIGEGKSFKPEYDLIRWRNREEEFDRWCKGMTGYPIVDAGMRELNATGYMHNRVRMITASFLAKHLLIDWRWGEAWFAQKLLDFDFAANNGGWQWAAGSGCDAAPYFRIFNPHLQTQKFDKELKYIRKWVPELDDLSYPRPVVEHEFARKRALQVYSETLRARKI